MREERRKEKLTYRCACVANETTTMDFFEKLQQISGSTALLLFFTTVFACFLVAYLLNALLQIVKLCFQRKETKHTFIEDFELDSLNMTSVNAYLAEQNRLNEEESKKIKGFKTVEVGKNFSIKIGEEKTVFNATFPGFRKIAIHPTEIGIYFLFTLEGLLVTFMLLL